MAVAVAEFQALLTRLANALGADVQKLLANADRLDRAELLKFVTEAYPELAAAYLQASGQLTTQWYAEQPVAIGGFVPVSAALAPAEQLAAQARWSVLQLAPIGALQGKATQMVFEESRRTVVENVEREGVRWARHASANACSFCRMLATRGAAYRSEATALRSHSHCHCLAVPDRDGGYSPPPYVARWQEQYRDARRNAGSGRPQAILTAWDRIIREG